jgi:glycosyltransferase involved in cell wall biosynthesis
MAFGLQPFRIIPEFLALADIVVIPQKRNFATIGQMPAKVFDAMAMEKAIVATSVSDLSEILDECGWIVEPDNPARIAEKIEYVLAHPLESKIMGKKARLKCEQNYSWDILEMVLAGVFDKYL